MKPSASRPYVNAKAMTARFRIEDAAGSRMSLRRVRLAIAVVMSTVTMLTGAIIWYALEEYRARALEGALADLRLEAEAEAERIGADFAGVGRAIFRIAADFEGAPTFGFGDRARMQASIVNELLANPNIGWISVADANGRVILSSRPWLVGSRLGGTPVFSEAPADATASPRLLIGLPMIGDVDGRSILPVARNVRAGTNVPGGIVGAFLDIDRLAGGRGGPESAIGRAKAIVRRDGELVVPLVGASVFPLSMSLLDEADGRATAVIEEGGPQGDRVVAYRSLPAVGDLVLVLSETLLGTIAAWQRTAAIVVGAWVIGSASLNLLAFAWWRSLGRRIIALSLIEDLARFPTEDPNPVLRIERTGKVVFANAAADKIAELLARPDGTGASPIASIIDEAAGDGSASRDVAVGDRVFRFSATAIPGQRHFNVYGVDVTERRSAERALEERDRQLRDAQRLAGLGYWTWDIRSDRFDWSPEMFRIVGINPVVPAPHLMELGQYLGRADMDRLLAAAEKARITGEPGELELLVRRPDGSRAWCTLTWRAERGRDDSVAKLWGVVHDVTPLRETIEALRQSQSQLTLAARVFDTSRQAISVTDVHGRILRVNKAFEEMTGYQEAEIIGKGHDFLSSGRQSPEFYARMWRQIEEEGGWEGELQDRRRSGEIFPVRLTVRAVRDPEGRLQSYVGFFIDQTERQAFEARVTHLVHHDALTDLPNRVFLRDRAEVAFRRAARSGTKVAVVFIDLDHFKAVNDSMGHDAGDKLLRHVAKRLTAQLRDSDTVSRQGGDEFIVLVPDLAQSEDAAVVAEKLIGTIADPYEIDGRHVEVGASAGVCIYPDNGETVDDILKGADTAMYAAKEAGRGRWRFFSPEMNARAVERSTIETELRQALRQGQLFAVYQPQVALADRRIKGYEALVRWNHPRHGELLPGRFIEVAEQTGLIAQIGGVMLREACREAASWPVLGQPLTIAVNVSPLQFREPGFTEEVSAVLAETGLDPRRLELEVTEAVFLRDADIGLGVFNELAAMGVRVAIDDFGTGYSSFAYLMRMHVDRLKIDRSFVAGLDQSSSSRAVAGAVVALARSLGLAVTAEGVETERQEEILRSLGCTDGQGWLYGRPMPADDVRKSLAEVAAEVQASGQ